MLACVFTVEGSLCGDRGVGTGSCEAADVGSGGHDGEVGVGRIDVAPETIECLEITGEFRTGCGGVGGGQGGEELLGRHGEGYVCSVLGGGRAVGEDAVPEQGPGR